MNTPRKLTATLAITLAFVVFIWMPLIILLSGAAG